MRKNGAEGYGIDTMVCSGPNADHILARTTTRTIEENDMVVLTFAPRYEGYHSACARVVFVGQPDKKQEDVALILGISRQQYQLYESGKREMPMHLFVMLAKHYNVSLDYLAGLIKTPKSLY